MVSVSTMSSPSASHKGAWEHVTEERDLSNLATQRTSADSACDDESAAKDEEEISIGTRSSTPHSDCSDSHLSTETELKRPVIVDDSDDENKENTGSFQVNPDIALELEEMQLFELADIQSALVVGRSLSPIALPDPDTSGVHMELLVEEGEEKTEVMNEEDGRIFHESEPMEENLVSNRKQFFFLCDKYKRSVVFLENWRSEQKISRSESYILVDSTEKPEC